MGISSEHDFFLPDGLFSRAVALYGTISNRRLCGVSRINGLWLVQAGNEKFIFPDKTAIKLNPLKLANKYDYFYKIRPDDIILHVGAAIGLDVWYFSQRVGLSGRIIAIEAYPENCKILKENVRLNGWDQVDAVESGVWEKAGTMKMFKYPKFTQHSMHCFPNRRETDIVEVNVDTLDRIISSKNIARIDLLHMNIEGAEIEALKGVADVLIITKRCIISTHTTDRGSTMPEVKEILEENGFKVKESTQVKTHLLGWKDRKV